MRSFTLALFLVLGLLSTAPVRAETSAAAQQPALGEVKKTIEDVVKVNETFPGTGKSTERRGKLRTLLNTRFDFEEMAKRSLGPEWLKISAEEQKEFVSVFSDLLARTYMDRIETATAGMVKVDTEKLDYPRSVVKTTVTSKGDSFPIDYKLLNENGAWRVYDVVIENIGLVANYRNEFQGIIRKEQFAGLLKRLREKQPASAKVG